MNSPRTFELRSNLRALLWLGVVLGASGCVAKEADDSAEVPDTRTNWLGSCVADSECNAGLSCECGVCTQSCSSSSQCQELGSAAVCSEHPSCPSTQSLCLDSATASARDASSGQDIDTDDRDEPIATDATTTSDTVEPDESDDTLQSDDIRDGEATGDPENDDDSEDTGATEPGTESDVAAIGDAGRTNTDASSDTTTQIDDAGMCVPTGQECFHAEAGVTTLDRPCCDDLLCAGLPTPAGIASSVCVEPSPPEPEWSSFLVSKGGGPCPEPAGCFIRHRFSPDGTVDIEEPEGTTEAILSVEDQNTLLELLASDELLAGMRDGFTCPTPPSDVGISFVLTFPEAEYTQSVTGCIFGNVEPVASLSSLADRY